MNDQMASEELDQAIEEMLGNTGRSPAKFSDEARQLAGIAGGLQLIAEPAYRSALKARLGAQIKAKAARAGAPVVVEIPKSARILPTLFGEGYGSYPIQRRNFAASVAIHCVVAAIVAGGSLWMARRIEKVRAKEIVTLVPTEGYVLPVAPTQSGGGGGGGDRDVFKASKGSLPRFAMQQITPPAIVVRNDTPKLAAEPTVVGAPSLTMPATGQVGDPLSAVLGPASNGTGTDGGIGSGSGGGVGTGAGPGVGDGRGGGLGGGIFRVGGGVSAPRPIYDPDPEFSEEARAAKYQGKVLLWVVVGADGRPRDVRVRRSLGMGLDERAIATVKTWRFEPAMKDGHPVAVQVNIEVNFRLY
jgi:periplasmic protein TonB